MAGKAAGVPVYRLLGSKHRDHCPISWWGVDMSPEDYASEARDAVKQGYTSFKQKARPWWDVYEQIRLSAAEVGPDFKFDYDFNEHLLNAAQAVPVLKELDKWPNVAIYEEPIPRGDVEGNKRVRAQTRCAIALHYSQPNVGDQHPRGHVRRLRGRRRCGAGDAGRGLVRRGEQALLVADGGQRVDHDG